MSLPVIQTPVVRRPAFWGFLGSVVAFGSIYYLENRLDPAALLEMIQALLALIGLGFGARSAFHGYRNWVARKSGLIQ